MQYHIRIKQQVQPQAIAALAQTIVDLDPAAVLDFHSAREWLSVATCLPRAELAHLCLQAGHAPKHDELVEEPSGCCGGCGG